MKPAAGIVIDGRYRLEALLGEGTFGEVWRAAQVRLADRPVAVKILRAEMSASAEVVTRFRNEAAALALLAVPNVVAVIDTGEWEGLRFLVMEFAEGRPLSAWLDEHRRAGTLPPLDEVWKTFAQICAGVSAAHAVKVPGPIVHRDLKSQNVLVPTTGPVKVLDFGIAQLGARSGTADGARMGTLTTMAPEQGLGRVDAIGPATDVFALAVVLLEMLTLQPYGPGGALWWVVAVDGDVRSKLPARPDVPVPVWDVLAAAMTREPADRIANADALATMIDAARGSETIASNAPPARRPLVRPAPSAATDPTELAPLAAPPRTTPVQALSLAVLIVAVVIAAMFAVLRR